MLKSFRSSVHGILAKILLALLFLSFVAWGIGDMITGPSANQTVAVVGDKTISANDYSRALYKETTNLRNMMGSEFSPEALQNMNLPARVLQNMLTRELLLLESSSVGLLPSDEDVVRRIRSNPAFRNAQGEFDKAQFTSALKSIGKSEKEYVAAIRDEIAINLLLDTLYSTIPLTDEVAPVVLKGREHKRMAELYALDFVKDNGNYKPSEEEVEGYYKNQSASFVAPEERKVSYLTISLDNIKLDEAATEEALKQQYEQRKEDFSLPEKREVSQLLFPSAEMAKSALDKAKSAKSFADIAKEVHALNETTTDMGLVKRENIIEEAANSVFSIEEGAVSEPIQSPFGWHLFKVVHIEPEKTLKFEEVRGQLENEVKKIQQDSALVQRVNEIEDAIAGGASLSEIAKDYNLTLKESPMFNSLGYDANGKRVDSLPEMLGFLDVSFQTEKDQISSVISAGGGQFFVLHVDEVVEQHVKDLADVKADIVESLKQIHKNALLQEKAAPLSEAFAGKADHKKLIREYNLHSLGTHEIMRHTRALKDIEIAPQLVADIFKYGEAEGTHAYPSGKHGFIVAVVKKDIPYKLNTNSAQTQAELQAIITQFSNLTRNEVVEQYSRYLRAKYRVTINNELIQSILQQQ